MSKSPTKKAAPKKKVVRKKVAPKKNPVVEKNVGGRPPKFATPEDMQKVIDAYFKRCKDEKRPLTMAGLALELDMSRQAFCDYTKKDEFLDTIKRARQMVEVFLEERLQGTAATGTIFNLKNNFGWKDKTEQKLTGKVITKIERTIVDPKHTNR